MDENYEKTLSNKTIALIYLMIANKGRYLAKDKIMLYLWPDSLEDAARYNLRYNLWLLKKILPPGENGETLIISEKDTCILNDNYPFECDLIDIKEFNFDGASINDLLYVRELFHGNIMEGWYLKNCNEFNEMILFDRMMCENRHMELLRALTTRYETKEEYSRSLEILKEMAVIEPDNEEIALKIMKNYISIGNRTAAISYYKNFETSLWNSLNITPNEEISSFYKSLYAGNQDNKSHSDQLETCNNRKEKLTIRGYCISNIEYFLIADVISQIVKLIKPQYLIEFNPGFVYDLSYIQRELLVEYGKVNQSEEQRISSDLPGLVPNVRLIHGFCNLIDIVTKYYVLELNVKNYKNIDSMSQGVIEYLEYIKVEGLIINVL
ncbi:BTAD domain-containing putative transcriptional regulator [Clostridium sp.]